MKRVLSVLLLSGFLGSCAMDPVQPQEPQLLVGRAIDAMGVAGVLASLNTIAVKGTAKFWEPEQSNVPGGEMRFANESSFESVRDFSKGWTRTDWVRNFAYPAPRTFKFSEIVTPGSGYVIGVDSNGRNKQSLSMNPPAHAMSGLRLAATQRELLRSSPVLLMEMRNNPGKVRSVADILVGDVAYPAVSYDAGSYTFVVAFDPKTDLPARIRTLDYDNVWGDVTYDLVYTEWRTTRHFGGYKVPVAGQYQLNGRTVIEYKISEIEINAAVAAERFEVPGAIIAGAPAPARDKIPYQWVLRRQFIGTYLDSESASYDSQSSPGLRLNELAPGVQHQVGGSHNTLIVEMKDYLVVFDAPVSDWQSNWTIAAVKAKYPEKPIRYLILTHHHMDHAGGLRAYLTEGATLVVGKGAANHYSKVIRSPSRRNPDLIERNLTGNSIIEVDDKYVLNDGRREVAAYRYDNPHAAATLMGYVADAKIVYVTDVYTPGPPLPPKINPALASVVNAVRKAGVQPQTVAGGHGGTAPYEALAKLAGN